MEERGTPNESQEDWPEIHAGQWEIAHRGYKDRVKEPSEVVRNCLGGQIKNVRHPRGCSFVQEKGLAGDINMGTCPLTRSHLQP